MRPSRLLTSLAAAALLVLPATAAAAQDDGGHVSVVHGVPDLPVDVYVDGEVLLEDFAPGTVTDPVALAAGSYDVAVREAGAAADSDPAISGSAEVTAGGKASIVAHLDADGAPTLTVFDNDLMEVMAGSGRLAVRHTAAAPAVDVVADGSVLFADLANGEGDVADVPAGPWDVAINAAGTDTEVVAVPDFQLADGVLTAVYAIGDLEAGTFDLLVETVDGLHGAPSGVPAGAAGLAAGGGDTPRLVAAGLLVVGGLALLVRRRGDA